MKSCMGVKAMKGRVLVTGGAGGIGNAIVRHLCGQASVGSVVSTFHHKPSQYAHEKLDWVQANVSDEVSVEALMQEVGPVDGIVNTVGFLHDHKMRPEKSVRQLSAEGFIQNMTVNTLPALLLAKHGQPMLRRSESSVFVALSARVGSIKDNRLGGWYSYRASKAALNMFIRSLSVEWQRTLPKCSVAALHPGTVDTALSAPFAQNVMPEKLFTAEQSAAYLISVIDQLTPNNSGRFWAWDGSEIDW